MSVCTVFKLSFDVPLWATASVSSVGLGYMQPKLNQMLLVSITFNTNGLQTETKMFQIPKSCPDRLHYCMQISVHRDHLTG